MLDGATRDRCCRTNQQWSKAVYHLYVVRVRDAKPCRHELAASGIGTGIHYPIPLHLQKAYRRLGYSLGDFPVSERVAPEILSLPMFPQLTFEQQQQVADKLLQSLDQASKVSLRIPVPTR